MTTKRKPPKLHLFLVKAEWRSTAMHLRVEATNEKQAWHKAWGQVAKMDGGDDCLKVTIVDQLT